MKDLGFSERLLRCLTGRGFTKAAETLAAEFKKRWQSVIHGDAPRWETAIDALPEGPANCRAEDGVVVAGDSIATQQSDVRGSLRQLMPWRKGPFRLAGVEIDSEWRCDWKWQRLAEHIQPLTGRLVLDVGCGNGYYIWRMLLAGAEGVLGIEPTMLYNYQHRAVIKLATGSPHDLPIEVFPTALEDLPTAPCVFDTIFSMGVLYHRRSPLDHLRQLHRSLRPGGEIVLESLVLDGLDDRCLLPRDRYAQMRNVWFIPTITLLEQMMARMRFKDIRVIDVTKTSTGEQRRTDWMEYESLADGLDPSDLDRTIEGYPAPRRAILIARRS